MGLQRHIDYCVVSMEALQAFSCYDREANLWITSVITSQIESVLVASSVERQITPAPLEDH